MKHCIIYKLVCTTNGKPYIGFTRQTLANRWHGHLSESRKGISNRILSSAIRKYGSKAFSKEILYCSTDVQHTLNVMEEHFIRKHNSHFKDGYGYNMTYGGEGKNSGPRNTPMSLEHRNKIRQANTGRKHTPEHIAARSWSGKTHSPETIEKMKQVTRTEDFKAARRAFRPSKKQIKQRVENRISRLWTLEQPDGTQIQTHYLKQTCKQHGVKYQALHKAFLEGRGINRGPTKGWRITSYV